MRARAALLLACAALAAAVHCSLLTSTGDLVGASPDAESTADGASSGASDGAANDGGGDVVNGDAPHDDAAAAVDAADAGCTGDQACPDGTCIAGACHPKPASIATAGKGIFGFAIAGNDLYWGHNDEVLRRALAGGMITRADPNGALGHMAWDANYVYFPRNTDISRVPLDGGASSPLYQGVDSPITGLAVTATDVYFTLQDTLRSVPIAGGNASVRVSGFVSAEGLHLSGNTLYVADRGAGTISTVPVGGATATPLLTNVPDVRDMFVAGTTMWLTQGANRTVVRTRADGTGPLETIAVGQTGISQVIVTSTSVYWASGTDIWTVPR